MPPPKRPASGRSQAVAIRPGVPADLPSLLQVYARAWRGAYRGVIPAAILDSEPLRASERRRLSEAMHGRRRGARLWVATRDGEVIGFVAAGPCRDGDAPPGCGEIYSIYLEPGSRGRGAGRWMLDHAVSWMRRAGFREARLWVLNANHRARRFYRAAGWRDQREQARMCVEAYPLIECRYRRALTPRGAA